MGVMPPWFIEKGVGIQDYQDDISLTEAEIETLAAWADSGAPRGNPADLPPPRVFADADAWDIGEPDLVVDTPSISLEANAPDWWGQLEPVASGLDEDRYVSALQIKEISDVSGGIGRALHLPPRDLDHARRRGQPVAAGRVGRCTRWGATPTTSTRRPDGCSGRGDQVFFNSVHMHANGEDTHRLTCGSASSSTRRTTSRSAGSPRSSSGPVRSTSGR